MPRRLAQQRMTLSDLEWPFHGSSTLKSASSASRAITAVAVFLVCFSLVISEPSCGMEQASCVVDFAPNEMKQYLAVIC